MCVCSTWERCVHNSLLGELDGLEVLVHRADLVFQALRHNPESPADPRE